jgi:putative transcriptional regulator
METNKLKNNIRRLRFEKGEMTQQQLADLVGVTRQTIIAIEQGKYSPSLLLAFQIAHAFSVPLNSVFQYEPENPAQLPQALI